MRFERANVARILAVLWVTNIVAGTIYALAQMMSGGMGAAPHIPDTTFSEIPQ